MPTRFGEALWKEESRRICEVVLADFGTTEICLEEEQGGVD